MTLKQILGRNDSAEGGRRIVEKQDQRPRNDMPE